MEKSHTINLSEALATFSDHIPDIRKACVENIQAIAVAHQPSKEMSDDDEFTAENIRLHLNHLSIESKTAPMMRTIKRIDGRKQHLSKQSITDADIEGAREYPITELWHELVGTPVRAGMTKCCFHDDNTASMSLRKYNRYRCFGCDAKGGTIDLYMKVNSVDFITAVKNLRGIM
jgi:hypothetical protein